MGLEIHGLLLPTSQHGTVQNHLPARELQLDQGQEGRPALLSPLRGLGAPHSLQQQPAPNKLLRTPVLISAVMGDKTECFDIDSCVMFWGSGPRGFNNTEQGITLPYRELKNLSAVEVTGNRARVCAEENYFHGLRLWCEVKLQKVFYFIIATTTLSPKCLFCKPAETQYSDFYSILTDVKPPSFRPALSPTTS